MALGGHCASLKAVPRQADSLGEVRRTSRHTVEMARTSPCPARRAVQARRDHRAQGFVPKPDRPAGVCARLTPPQALEGAAQPRFATTPHGDCSKPCPPCSQPCVRTGGLREGGAALRKKEGHRGGDGAGGSHSKCEGASEELRTCQLAESSSSGAWSQRCGRRGRAAKPG